MNILNCSRILGINKNNEETKNLLSKLKWVAIYRGFSGDNSSY